MISWAVDTCRERGCRIIQLTSDKARKDAAEFYRALGFVASERPLMLYSKLESNVQASRHNLLKILQDCYGHV